MATSFGGAGMGSISAYDYEMRRQQEEAARLYQRMALANSYAMPTQASLANALGLTKEALMQEPESNPVLLLL